MRLRPDRLLAQQARVGAELAETNSETAQGLSEAARDKLPTMGRESRGEVETGSIQLGPLKLF